MFTQTGGEGYGLMAIHVLKPNLVLNRPVYAGMSVLDLPKTVMYHQEKIWQQSKSFVYRHRLSDVSDRGR